MSSRIVSVLSLLVVTTASHAALVATNNGTQGLAGFSGNHTSLLANRNYLITGTDNLATILNVDDYAGLCTYRAESPFVISVAANGTTVYSARLKHLAFCDPTASNATYTITLTGTDVRGTTTYTDTFTFVAASASAQGIWLKPGMANYGQQLKSFTLTVRTSGDMRNFRFSSFTIGESLVPPAGRAMQSGPPTDATASTPVADAAPSGSHTGQAPTSSATAASATQAPAAGLAETGVSAGDQVASATDTAAGTPRSNRLIGLSARGMATGDTTSDNLLAGFVIAGTHPKTVLVRAVGPSLSEFGVQDALATPSVRVLNGATKVAEVSGWQPSLAAEFNRLGAFPLRAGSRDTAVELTLDPGPYSLELLDGGNRGVALVEIYDASANPGTDAPRLINLSSRGHAGTGAEALTGGFVVAGEQPKKVLIRAIGPGLAAYGITNGISDPVLCLYDSKSNLVARNDNWGAPADRASGSAPASGAEIAAAAKSVGAFPLASGSKDAALIVDVPAGAYTASVSNADRSDTGVALIEVYELP